MYKGASMIPTQIVFDLKKKFKIRGVSFSQPSHLQTNKHNSYQKKKKKKNCFFENPRGKKNIYKYIKGVILKMKGVKISWESVGEPDSDAPFFSFSTLMLNSCAKSDNRNRDLYKDRTPF
jgi:hypothetical protein